jgi:TRAP-type C4-dicarboxylate transport system permease small subunit
MIKSLQLLKRVVYPASRVFSWIAAISLGGLVFLMTVTSIWRYGFRTPIGGSIELIEILMSFTVFFGLGYVMTKRGHITFDLVVSRLPQKAQAVIHSIVCLLSAGLFALMSWRTTVHGIKVWYLGEITGDLSIPLAPFFFVAALGMAVLCLVLVVQFLCSLLGRINNDYS